MKPCREPMALLVMLAAIGLPQSANCNEKAKIIIEPLREAYPAGSPIIVKYTFQSLAGTRLIASGRRLGVPFEVIVTDSRDRRIPPSGFEFDVPTAHALAVWAGPRVQFAFELTELFDLKDPGAYQVRATWEGQEIYRSECEIVGMQDSDKFEVSTLCVNPANVDQVNRGLIGPVNCSFEVRKGKTKAGRDLTLVSANQVTMDSSENGQRKLDFPPLASVDIQDVKVVQYELDFQWRLWLILESGGKTALRVFDLRHGFVRTLVEWQSAELILQSIPRTVFVRGNLVVAGAKGKQQYTSYSQELRPFCDAK